MPVLLLWELILHAVTTAFENDRFGVMEEPIQNGTGDGRVVIHPRSAEYARRAKANSYQYNPQLVLLDSWSCGTTGVSSQHDNA